MFLAVFGYDCSYKVVNHLPELRVKYYNTSDLVSIYVV